MFQDYIFKMSLWNRNKMKICGNFFDRNQVTCWIRLVSRRDVSDTLHLQFRCVFICISDIQFTFFYIIFFFLSFHSLLFVGQANRSRVLWLPASTHFLDPGIMGLCVWWQHRPLCQNQTGVQAKQAGINLWLIMFHSLCFPLKRNVNFSQLII